MVWGGTRPTTTLLLMRTALVAARVRALRLVANDADARAPRRAAGATLDPAR